MQMSPVKGKSVLSNKSDMYSDQIEWLRNATALT